MKYDENSLYNIKSSMEGKRFSLFDLAIWKNGLAFKKTNFSERGVPVIKISELNNGISGATAYTQQKFPETVHLNKGDLLFSWSGNPQTSIDVFRFNL
jgi:hsdS, type I site-specific deoxyribonuclease